MAKKTNNPAYGIAEIKRFALGLMAEIRNNPAPMFSRVTIIGVGLLGASLGLAIKERRLARTVIGVGRKNSPSLEIALSRKAIDEAQTDPAIGVKGSDLVVLCTPVRQFPENMNAIAASLKPDAIVTDVGSTKQQVMKWAAEFLPKSVYFVGSHPMAGSEKRGPEFAKADLYVGAFCYMCPNTLYCNKTLRLRSTGRPAMQLGAAHKIDRLWQALGMRTEWIPARKHDQCVAAISHLPHAAAFSLVNTAALVPEALPAAANGFIDTTRVASSDVQMWTDIFLTNPNEVVAMMNKYIGVLEKLRNAIKRGDEQSIRNHLTSAKEKRDALIRQRNAGKTLNE